MYIEITNVEIWIKVHTVLWLPKLAVRVWNQAYVPAGLEKLTHSYSYGTSQCKVWFSYGTHFTYYFMSFLG